MIVRLRNGQAQGRDLFQRKTASARDKFLEGLTGTVNLDRLQRAGLRITDEFFPIYLRDPILGDRGGERDFAEGRITPLVATVQFVDRVVSVLREKSPVRIDQMRIQPDK